MTAQPNKAVVSTETNPTGYAPGEGDAYDYIPSWMNVPRLYQTEKQDDPLAVIKLFTPDSSWTWYVIEYDAQEERAFGLVAGFETELGYFSISEIRGVEGPLGLPIERDLWFRPTPVTQLPEYRARWGERGGPYKGAIETEVRDEDHPNAGVETHTLTFGDNGVQVYFEGEEYLLLNPYLKKNGQRYATGWIWHYRDESAGDEWRCLPDPEVGPDTCIGAFSLQEAVAYAERVTDDRFELVGAPDDLPDSYPVHEMWGGSEAHTNAKPWLLTRRQYQGREAETFAGGVPILDADDAREHERIVREALERGCPVPDHVLADYPDLVTAEKAPRRRDIPSGSLRIVYLGDAPDGIVWTGDTRSFRQHSEGSEGLRQAFDFLNTVKGHIEAADGCRVVAIQKDFGKGVHARVEPARTGSECLQIEGWEGFDLSLTPSSNLAGELGYLVRNCYAEPGVPDDWSAPGLHLAQHVRALIRRAHTALQERDGKVFWTELWAEFGELSRADELLSQVEQVWLWSRERFLEGMDDVQVVKRQSWTYCKPDERRLAKKYRRDRDNLMAALAKAKTATRRNDVLSELADLDALPDEYIPAEKAGKVGVTEDTHTASTSDVSSAPDTDGKETEPAAKKAKPKLPDDIPEAIEVDLGHTHGWATAQVLKVNGKWLYYRLDDETKADKRKGKVQVYGRDIVWRVPEGEITNVSNN
jgi:hypothetical protein